MLIARKELMLPLFVASTLALSVGAPQDAAAAVGDPDTVTCAYPIWVGFGPVHLANELGYFEEEGITVEEILDDDMPNAVAAMERGDPDREAAARDHGGGFRPADRGQPAWRLPYRA